MTQPVSNSTPAASAEPDGHLGEIAIAAAILLLLGHAHAAEALEHRGAEAAARPVLAAAQELLRWATRLWQTRFGDLYARIDEGQWADLRAHVVRETRDAKPADPTEQVLRFARQAHDLGVKQAAESLNIPTPPEQPLEKPTVELARDTGRAVDTRYAATERLLTSTPVESLPQLVQALAPTMAAASDVDRIARTVVNTAVNDGTQKVAVENNADLLWFAERDACVVCLALQGLVVKQGESFPAKATFGDKPIAWWTPPGVTLLRPPRHPRCRCRVEPYLGHAGPPGSLTLPQALRREAERSVLKGWSVPSESEQVRLRAADRLLKRGTDLPRSVQDKARNAVRRGHFTSRDVPQPAAR